MNIYERAIAHLEETARSLRESTCLGTDWLNEHEAKAEHDDLLATANGLRLASGIAGLLEKDIDDLLRATCGLFQIAIGQLGQDETNSALLAAHGILHGYATTNDDNGKACYPLALHALGGKV